MNKRPHEEANGSSHPHKKHKGHNNYRPHPNDRPHHDHRRQYDHQRRDDRPHHNNRNHHQSDQRSQRDHRGPPASAPSKQYLSHDEALAKLPPPTSKSNHVPGYVPFDVPSGLPDAPEITDPKFKDAPFTHRSAIDGNRSTETVEHTSYERLELLGDAYLELFASRLIFARLAHLPAGRMSQIRELLVKNETLAEYAKTYGFDKQISALDMQHMQQDLKLNVKGNKGFNKILGDVFEAYVAAVVLSDLENGFAIAEKWLTALWAPKLQFALEHDSAYDPNSLLHAQNEDPRKRYDPNAKHTIQKRIATRTNGVKLEYKEYAKMQELKGDLKGQNRWFIAVYVTGEGYQERLLGKGEGRNKVEAGNWAAIEAMYGDSKDIIEDLEKRLEQHRAARREEEQAARRAEEKKIEGKEEVEKQAEAVETPTTS